MGRLVIISGDDDFAVKERARAVAGELAGGEFEENPAVEIIAGDGGGAQTGRRCGALSGRVAHSAVPLRLQAGLAPAFPRSRTFFGEGAG
ncbi:MAG: hypothetical protein L6W00_13910 [Lentisphaeria bacterium]|nr:MAG: hypothetical protein L6W00_13910 [Lentisphaeria bacterium]